MNIKEWRGIINTVCLQFSGTQSALQKCFRRPKKVFNLSPEQVVLDVRKVSGSDLQLAEDHYEDHCEDTDLSHSLLSRNGFYWTLLPIHVSAHSAMISNIAVGYRTQHKTNLIFVLWWSHQVLKVVLSSPNFRYQICSLLIVSQLLSFLCTSMHLV